MVQDGRINHHVTVTGQGNAQKSSSAFSQRRWHVVGVEVSAMASCRFSKAEATDALILRSRFAKNELLKIIM